MSRNEVQWRCRRSILELDLLFSNFFESHYDLLSPQERLLFHELILEEDPVLQDIFFNLPSDHSLVTKMLDSQTGEGICSKT